MSVPRVEEFFGALPQATRRVGVKWRHGMGGEIIDARLEGPTWIVRHYLSNYWELELKNPRHVIATYRDCVDLIGAHMKVFLP